ncbi:hypothetical protein GPJ56_000145 [Histomonas meleagridis]|uniref:uncharacterized protein n=1 Tax=Histomonas meleagridis TaxID=135588 RepID=UPI00355957D7|nr:hypothetical protein GPJ56_000145 [Histomonas meleagridis]KAH0805644.1 hypothetical protein GO595_001699 [Histomonas meleagridis]
MLYHVKQLPELLENVFDFFNDDENYMYGILSKLQYQSLVSYPTEGLSLTSQKGIPHIAAPPIDNDLIKDEIYTDDDEIEVSYKGIPSPVLTHLMKLHIPKPPPITVDSFDERLHQMAIDELSNNILDMYLKQKEPKSKRKPETRSPITTSQTNLPDTNPKPIKQTKSNTDKPTITIAESTLPSQAIEEFLDTITNTNNSKPPRSAKPKLIPYIELIPSALRGRIFSSIAKQLMISFARAQCPQIIRPILQNKKKAYQKRIRDEKLQKQRNEERQKLAAMRQRKEIAIREMSERLFAPILSSFIRNEVYDIYNEEQQKAKEQSEVKIAELQKADENKVPPPVIMSGLVSRRHLNPLFIRELFSGFNFAIDETKIRFRCNLNRFEVVMYFETYNEVSRALALSPLQVEYTTAFLYTDQKENKDWNHKTYTGQEMQLTNARNEEAFKEKSGYTSMSPIVCLESTLKIDDDTKTVN